MFFVSPVNSLFCFAKLYKNVEQQVISGMGDAGHHSRVTIHFQECPMISS